MNKSAYDSDFPNSLIGHTLVGPQYALLRREFMEERDEQNGEQSCFH